MDSNFVNDYSILFISIVIFCSIVLLYLVFVVNDKIQNINKENITALKLNNEKESNRINQQYDTKRKILISESKRIIQWILLFELLVNILIILIEKFYSVISIIGGILFPKIAYFILIFFLLVAVGLKGSKVLIVKGLIHGR